MPTRTMLVITWVLALAGCRPGSRGGDASVQPGETTEVTGRDLPPEQEIDALLEGTSELGRGGARIKVAVLPFEVRKGDAAMGAMVADVIAHNLTGAAGVTVLERERVDVLVDELRRGKEPDLKTLTEKAKLAGVDAYVLGTVHAGKRDESVVYCRVVDTAAGVRRKDIEIPIEGRQWREGVAAKSRELARELGAKERGRRVEPVHELDPEGLKKATAARELQYSGKPAEAAKLYAEAMPRPTNAWQLEADYITLMNEFEMDEWVTARADAVLSRLPPGPSTACTRARLLALRLPAYWTRAAHVEEARTVVRAAASCGDPAVIATALIQYADVVKSIHAPLAAAAIARADRVAGVDADAWTRCEIDLRKVHFRMIDGRGGAEVRREFMGHAAGCAKAHDYHAAAMAARFAANAAWSPDDAIADLAQGAKWAERSGGAVVNTLRIAHADALRRAGYTSSADAELLALLATWLDATIELHGALPAAEARLDDELLARAGVARPSGVPRTLDEDAELRAKFVRRSLAAVLQQWAIRTRADSGPEAKFYEEIAAEMDPARRVDTRPPLERLAADGIDIDALLARDTSPHREEAPDFAYVLDTLHSAYLDARGRDAAVTERERILNAFKRIAVWQGARLFARTATWMSARHRADLGNLKHALSELRALDATAGDDPTWDAMFRYPLEAEIVGRQSPAGLDPILDAWLAAARKVSAPTWVEVASRVEASRLQRAPRTEEVRAKALLAVRDALVERKQWLAAADATYAAAGLLRHANISGGTEATVNVVLGAIGLIDRLEDPLRSALVRASVLSEIWSLYGEALEARHAAIAFGADPSAQVLVGELTAFTQKLVDAGRTRDAVRVIVSMPGLAPGADRLLADAERLAPSFAQSLEYPLIMGKWWVRVGERLEGPGLRHALEQAFALLQGTERKDLAHQVLTGLVRTALDEADLAATYDRCLKHSQGVVAQRLACIGGVSSYVVNAASAARRVRQPEIFGRAFADLDAIWAQHGASMAESEGILVKEAGVLLAVAAGDFRLVDALLTELVAYFEKQADSPHLGNFGSSLWLAARLDHPKEALALIERLAASASATDRFIASMAADAARTAWQLGDVARADRLYAAGRAAAERTYGDLLYRYDVLAGDRALVAKRPDDARAAYERVRGSNEAKRNVVVDHVGAARLAAAALLTDPRFDVDAAATALGTTPSPCAAADWLEIRAGASLARKLCPAAAKLRADAEVVGRTCTEPAYRLRAKNACGKPFAASIGEDPGPPPR